jgi:hypothetical protein
MIRAVLVGWSDDDWRLYRQPQWMAEVRRSPEASALPRRHFDIEDGDYSRVLAAWAPGSTGSSLADALEVLGRFGAVEIARP